jgi:hypothetical protein
MIVPRIALQSLRNRALTASLTVLAIAFSVMLLLGVEKVRTGARQSFADTISGTDLIVGARSGAIQLLLYSVFRIGNATNNVTWKSYSDIAKRAEVEWIVPISLGDSHHGFRVLGTTPDYFAHYKYRHGQSLAFAEGKAFSDLFDAVIGADVAQALGYKVGDEIVVAHGVGSISFVEHKDKPFRVVGILAKTGTPVDRTVHVSLEAIEAIHVDWQNGMPMPGQSISADAQHLEPPSDGVKRLRKVDFPAPEGPTSSTRRRAKLSIARANARGPRQPKRTPDVDTTSGVRVSGSTPPQTAASTRRAAVRAVPWPSPSPPSGRRSWRRARSRRCSSPAPRASWTRACRQPRC